MDLCTLGATFSDAIYHLLDNVQFFARVKMPLFRRLSDEGGIGYTYKGV